MAPRPRPHPAVVLAAVGAALSLGVGAMLPYWVVIDGCGWGGSTVGDFGRVCYISSGTLWQAAVGVTSYVKECGEVPPWQWWLHNGGVAAGLLAAGAVAGLVSWFLWTCLRTPLPPPGSEPAGR